MTISDSTVAIIGTGNIGGRLAANFAAGGQDFLLASRDADAARKIASDLAEVVSVDEAVERADVLVLAVWFDIFKQLIAQYGERLARLCHGLNRAKQKKTSRAAPPAIFTPVRRRQPAPNNSVAHLRGNLAAEGVTLDDEALPS